MRRASLYQLNCHIAGCNDIRRRYCYGLRCWKSRQSLVDFRNFFPSGCEIVCFVIVCKFEIHLGGDFIGYVYFIVFAVCFFPNNLQMVDDGSFLKIHVEPLVVAVRSLRLPTSVKIVVNRQFWRPLV